MMKQCTPSRPSLRLVQELDDDLPDQPSTEMDELFDDGSSFYDDGLPGDAHLSGVHIADTRCQISPRLATTSCNRIEEIVDDGCPDYDDSASVIDCQSGMQHDRQLLGAESPDDEVDVAVLASTEMPNERENLSTLRFIPIETIIAPDDLVPTYDDDASPDATSELLDGVASVVAELQAQSGTQDLRGDEVIDSRQCEEVNEEGDSREDTNARVPAERVSAMDHDVDLEQGQIQLPVAPPIADSHQDRSLEAPPDQLPETEQVGQDLEQGQGQLPVAPRIADSHQGQSPEAPPDQLPVAEQVGQTGFCIRYFGCSPTCGGEREFIPNVIFIMLVASSAGLLALTVAALLDSVVGV